MSEQEIQQTTITPSSECNELKTIKYKSMMANGIAWPEKKNASDLTNLDKFLKRHYQAILEVQSC